MIASLRFLLRFVLAASLGMGLWLWLGSAYLELVTPAVNVLAAWLDVPLRLMQEGQRVLYDYQPPGGRHFRLLATGQESIYLNLVVMGAVFAATPGRCISWRLGWAGVAFSLLWGSHVLSFYVGGHVAIWQFAQSDAHALALAQQLVSWIPPSRVPRMQAALEAWNLWGRYGMCVLLWIVVRARPEPVPVPATAGLLPWARRLVPRPSTA